MSKPVTRNLFIDTSAFCREGFNINGSKLKAIGELARLFKINVFLTDVIVREIYARLDESSQELQDAHAKLSRKISGLSSLLKDTHSELVVSLETSLVADTLKSEFDQYLNNINAEILNTREVSVDNVFDLYFEGNPPFGKGKKKSEFPDAFTLLALEKWCDSTKEEMLGLRHQN